MASKKLNKPKKKKPKKGSYARNEKYPALNTRRQVFARQEYMDGDYYHKLTDEEKAWMNAFLSETIVTNFYHGGPELYTDVADKRQFYRDNNSRNKDALNWAKAKSMLSNVEDVASSLDREELKTPSDVEDSWLESIDLKGSDKLKEALRLTDEDKKMLKENKLKHALNRIEEAKKRSKKSNKPSKVAKKRPKKNKK